MDGRKALAVTVITRAGFKEGSHGGWANSVFVLRSVFRHLEFGGFCEHVRQRKTASAAASAVAKTNSDANSASQASLKLQARGPLAGCEGSAK